MAFAVVQKFPSTRMSGFQSSFCQRKINPQRLFVFAILRLEDGFRGSCLQICIPFPWRQRTVKRYPSASILELWFLLFWEATERSVLPRFGLPLFVNECSQTRNYHDFHHVSSPSVIIFQESHHLFLTLIEPWSRFALKKFLVFSH